MTPAGIKALVAMTKTADCCIYAGQNPGGPTVAASTLASLSRAGLVVLGKTSAGETFARLTPKGTAVAEESVVR